MYHLSVLLNSKRVAVSNLGHKITIMVITAMCISSYITHATDVIPIKVLMSTLRSFRQMERLFFGKRHGPNGISGRHLLIENEQGPIGEHFQRVFSKYL